MNNNATIEKMRQMRLSGMAETYYNSIQSANYHDYTTDQYIAMLVDQEWEYRQERKITGLVAKAKFKQQVSILDIDYNHPRNLDRNLFERLVSLDFIRRNENIIITGPTGCGKSYLAQALGMHACQMTYKTSYFNTARLMEQVKLSKLQGDYLVLLKKIQNTQLLILDDFGLTAIDQMQRQALLDIVEHKYDNASIIFTSQIPVKEWHGLIAEHTIADAILDRIVYSSHRIELNGQSMRKMKLKK
ncbi:ATP-binding protein [Maribellus comscasis]|uniref:ATP-binding protein n=1 Tax=Maribellus comscasis TaxID=2681766 RepID=A0A6I6K2F5_9BACT|nr:IS21-like element helper ATPase IstB [Maribellus comscasis]QGY47580.1 ATP-binding protein [Maribellus comscasis]